MICSTVRAHALFLVCFTLLNACADEDMAQAASQGQAGEVALADKFSITSEASERAALATATAGPGVLAQELQLPGSIRFAEDRRAAIVSRLDGLVAEVHGGLGDRVEEGQLLAVLHSRELARARSAYIESAYRLRFSEVALAREQHLWDKRISSEQDYLMAQQALETAKLELRTAGQELRALGVGDHELQRLADTEASDDPGASEAELTRFERVSPMTGVVVERNAVLGEAVRADDRLFVVADLSTVWVDLRVRASDLIGLRIGEEVTVESEDLGLRHRARISYLGPQVEADTQTALARVELANEEGVWRPGLYVTVYATIGERSAAVVVPAEAVHILSQGAVVFVSTASNSWEAREVVVGEMTGTSFEVLSGLEPGEIVATTNSLFLKSVWLGQGAGD